MKPDELLPFTASIRGVGRPLAYYPSFARFLGNTSAAIFLCHFMYWEGKQEDEDGWIYKRSADIMKETGLGRYEVEGARKRLIQYGLMLERKTGSPPQMHYKFEWQTFDERFCAFMKDKTAVTKIKKKAEPVIISPEEAIRINELGLFKDSFDLEYVAEYKNPYLWSRDKKGGKDWFHLKEIRNKIFEWKKKKNRSQNIMSDPEFADILIAWDFLLQKMTRYHRERNFSPALINSYFNDIVRDILNEQRPKLQKQPVNRNAQAAATAKFV